MSYQSLYCFSFIISFAALLKCKVFQSVLSSEGYSGLVNQGATCYLNAVLQTLFMTKKFREAIMKYALYI